MKMPNSPEECGGGAKAAERARDVTQIACTLQPADFKERITWLRDLARHSLRVAERTPLALRLTYDRSAAADVAELVRRERACCAFLHFELREDAGGVQLTVTAPEEARAATDAWFDHFAPSLAREPSTSTQS
jgi:hypothetical protein